MRLDNPILPAEEELPVLYGGVLVGIAGAEVVRFMELVNGDPLNELDIDVEFRIMDVIRVVADIVSSTVELLVPEVGVALAPALAVPFPNGTEVVTVNAIVPLEMASLVPVVLFDRAEEEPVGLVVLSTIEELDNVRPLVVSAPEIVPFPAPGVLD